MTDASCKQTISAIASGKIFDAPPLVRCTIDQLAEAFPGLAAAADNIGRLGKAGVRMSWRAVREGIAGDVLRVWHDGGRVLAIELERPQPIGGWPALRSQLGTPAQKFDVYRDVVKIDEGLWFYGERGVATQTSLAGERLDRVIAFPPTSADDFVAHIAVSLSPPRELPMD